MTLNVLLEKNYWCKVEIKAEGIQWHHPMEKHYYCQIKLTSWSNSSILLFMSYLKKEKNVK